jgi:hypothetical protein
MEMHRQACEFFLPGCTHIVSLADYRAYYLRIFKFLPAPVLYHEVTSRNIIFFFYLEYLLVKIIVAREVNYICISRRGGQLI